MNHRTLAGTFLFLIALTGAARGRAQADESTQSPGAISAPSSASAHRIISKDPEYVKLLTAPLKDDFVRTYSQGYRDKSAEIDAKVADISDATLRNKARADEWGNVPQKDQDRFTYEADVALRDARISFSRKHRDAWLDVGRVTYIEDEKSLVVKSYSTAPIDAHLRVPMSAANMKQIYDLFRLFTGPEIDRQAHEYVFKSGADSPCSRNPDWCFQIKRDEIEQNFRSDRIVVIAQGDLEQNKIEGYLLVDYDTEAILSEPVLQNLNLTSLAWRFKIPPVPTRPYEPEPVQAPVQPVPVPGRHEVVVATIAPTEAEPIEQPPAEKPPARIQIPPDVIAAAIISRTSPQYPPRARAAHVHGDVVLHAVIDKEGKVSGIQVLSGDDLLVQAAVDAVLQWRYKPILIESEPTEVDTTITITFSLIE